MKHRSAAAGWAVLIGWVVAWDLIAPRMGYETLSATWRRWGRTKPGLRCGLATAVSWLDHHLEQ